MTDEQIRVMYRYNDTDR